MRTVRQQTFETNSSSAHCIVVADSEDFAKFVNGELFADEASYKCGYDARLLTADEVYEKYHEYFLESVIQYDDDAYQLSKDTVIWLMNHWEEVQPIIDYHSDVYSVDSMPLHVKGECEANSSSVSDLLNWLDFLYTPFSYSMLKFFTEDFTTEYDDKESEPPKETDGKTSCYSCWYY